MHVNGNGLQAYSDRSESFCKRCLLSIGDSLGLIHTIWRWVNGG